MPSKGEEPLNKYSSAPMAIISDHESSRGPSDIKYEPASTTELPEGMFSHVKPRQVVGLMSETNSKTDASGPGGSFMRSFEAMAQPHISPTLVSESVAP